MRRVMVQYKVKPNRAGENEQLIEKVFEALEREQTAGVRYRVAKLADGATYIHVASIDTSDGSNALTALPEFKEYVAGIKERCDEQPMTTEWTEVGVYDSLVRA